MSDHAGCERRHSSQLADAAILQRLFGEHDDRRAALKLLAQAVGGVAHASLQIGAAQHVERQRRILADRREDQNPLVEAASDAVRSCLPSRSVLLVQQRPEYSGTPVSTPLKSRQAARRPRARCS